MRLIKKLKPPYEKVAGEDYVYTSETRLTPAFAKVEQKLGQLEDILEEHNIETLEELDSLLQSVKQIKSIEEELGIDLITLFNALKNGIYRFTIGRQLIKDYVCLIDNCVSIGCRNKLSYSLFSSYDRTILFFQDYGKTWALTKEELL